MELFLEKLIDLAIAEDIGDGDHSALASIPADAVGKAKLLFKDEGIIAGIDIALQVFKKVDSSLNTTTFYSDGDRLKFGDIAFITEGSVRSLLQAERIILNIMQRMSGIATKTNQYVKEIEGTHAVLLDTRKTTPGMRYLEKLAVKIGGAQNHRFGLFDMIMLKDNHIDYAGGIAQAISRTHEYLNGTGRNLRIEVEVRTEAELDQVLFAGGVDRIMLDNFTPERIAKVIPIINGRYETEASGGITIENIRQYALTGVDYISVGALTHSVRSLDMSFKAIH